MLFCYIENAKVVKKSGLLCMLRTDFLKINLSDIKKFRIFVVAKWLYILNLENLELLVVLELLDVLEKLERL